MCRSPGKLSGVDSGIFVAWAEYREERVLAHVHLCSAIVGSGPSFSSEFRFGSNKETNRFPNDSVLDVEIYGYKTTPSNHLTAFKMQDNLAVMAPRATIAPP